MDIYRLLLVSFRNEYPDFFMSKAGNPVSDRISDSVNSVIWNWGFDALYVSIFAFQLEYAAPHAHRFRRRLFWRRQASSRRGPREPARGSGPRPQGSPAWTSI